MSAMKKTALIIGMSLTALALVAAVVVVLVLLVFSDDTNKAKDLIGKAMPQMALVQQQIEALAPQVDSLLERTLDMGSEAEYQAAIAPIRAQVHTIDEELDKANLEYAQVNGLRGLQPYKEYAKVAQALVRNDHTLTAQVNYYLDDMVSMIHVAGAPSELDAAEYNTRSSEFITMFNGLRGDAAKLKEQADKMRAEL